MAKRVDPYSDTWDAVVAFAEQERNAAINALIADRHSEQQRGKIEVLDDLLRLSSPQERPTLVEDTYT